MRDFLIRKIQEFETCNLRNPRLHPLSEEQQRSLNDFFCEQEMQGVVDFSVLHQNYLRTVEDKLSTNKILREIARYSQENDGVHLDGLRYLAERFHFVQYLMNNGYLRDDEENEDWRLCGTALRGWDLVRFLVEHKSAIDNKIRNLNRR